MFNGALECQFRKYQLFDGKYKEFRSDNSDKEFKPKREERPARPRRQGEKVEYGRKERKDGGRGERKEGFRSDRKEGFRKDADRKETFRGRKAGDGKEFTRERRKEFKYKEDSKPRTPRPSTDDGARKRLLPHATCTDAAARRKVTHKIKNRQNMKRIYFLFFLCCMTTLATFAQEKKTYTLEDVIPGGNNYFNLVPENIPGLQWWGDVCVRADVENIRSIQLKDGKESILVTLEEINQAIEKGEKPYQLSHELKPLRSLMSASLPWSERKVIVFQQNSYWVEYDFGQKKITNISRLNEKATNLDFCKTNDKVAYTVGNGLFVTGKGEESHQINPSQTEEGVVYGQAVHRNEFGIYKGTFWSPKEVIWLSIAWTRVWSQTILR